MEWIKNMSLKKSLFTLTFVNLLLAVILSAVVFWSCTKLSAALDPSDVQIVVGADAITKTEFPEPTAGTAVAGNVLAVLQFCLPILFFIVALILTASLFGVPPPKDRLHLPAIQSAPGADSAGEYHHAAASRQAPAGQCLFTGDRSLFRDRQPFEPSAP